MLRRPQNVPAWTVSWPHNPGHKALPAVGRLWPNGDDDGYGGQPQPEWSAWAGDDGREVGAAKRPDLRRVALVPVSDLIRVVMIRRIVVAVMMMMRVVVVVKEMEQLVTMMISVE